MISRFKLTDEKSPSTRTKKLRIDELMNVLREENVLIQQVKS